MQKTDNAYKLKGDIPVQIIKEELGYVIVCHQLNVASQGDTYEEAIQMFQEALDLFFTDLIENGDLEEVLLESGFKIEIHHDSSPFAIIIPPEISNANIKLPSLA